MRLIARLALTSVAALTISFAVPVFVNRADYTRAVTSYADSPNPENDRVLRAERAKNQNLELITHLAGAGALFVLMNAGWSLLRRSVRSREIDSGKNTER